MENDNKKIEHITRTDLEEQTQVLLFALDNRLNKIQGELKADISGVESRLGEKIDDLQTSVDGFVKKQSDFEDKHVIISIKQPDQNYFVTLSADIILDHDTQAQPGMIKNNYYESQDADRFKGLESQLWACSYEAVALRSSSLMSQ